MNTNIYNDFDPRLNKNAIAFWLESLPLNDIKRLASAIGISRQRNIFAYVEEIEMACTRERLVKLIKKYIFKHYRLHFKFSHPIKKRQVILYASFLTLSETLQVLKRIRELNFNVIVGKNLKHNITEIQTCKISPVNLYHIYEELNLIPNGKESTKTHKKMATKISCTNACDENVLKLNTSIELEVVIHDVEQFYQYLKTNKNPLFHNYNLLFHGPPGTGKTMFAGRLADQLGLKLITVTASDLLSHYVGETEEFIAGAFQEAQKKKAILFLDEMDAILGERDSAGASWERSQVNEFLVQMERFQGVFIAATNFPKIIDRALERRFAHKIAFNYLQEKSLEDFFSYFFKFPLTQTEREQLTRMRSLAPGDFRVALQRGFFRPEQSAALYLQELERIHDAKKDRRSIGLQAA